MNKLIITIVATLLMSGSALAQDIGDGPGKKGQRHHQGMEFMPGMEKLTRAIRHLDLDEEQKAGVHAIMKGLREDVRPIMQEMKAGHMQLKELVKAESLDEQAVAAVAETEGLLAAERIKIAARAMSEIFALLTDEQREQLEAMAAERGQRHTEKRGGFVEES
jgi:Spy/CpxP family protein refolding chaperone